jgi:hypothetical protein
MIRNGTLIISEHDSEKWIHLFLPPTSILYTTSTNRLLVLLPLKPEEDELSEIMSNNDCH